MELVRDEWNLEDIIRKLVKTWKNGKYTSCATGNVHYLHENDAMFRKILS